MKFLYIILILLTPSIGFSAPTISSVGTLTNGQAVSITGLNFGSSGPNIVVFDDFTGTVGDPISLQATVGAWSGTHNSPIYVSDGENIAARLINAGGSRQVQVDFFTGVQEFFLSYRVEIPPSYHFPNTVQRGDFAPDSAWKMAWIFDDSTYSGYQGDDDIVIPTWGNGTYFMVGGNDNAFQLETGRPTKSTNWFSFDGWNRATTYMKGGADPVNDNGTVWFSGLSEEFGNKIFTKTDAPIFDGDDNDYDNAISQWTHLNVPGWNRTGGVNSAYDSTTMADYDDIYLATGANAAARVEIGDNASYAGCTNLAISTPTAWSDTSITTTIREGGFSSGDSVYVFVIDADNTPSSGYGPLTFGAGQSTPLRSGTQITRTGTTPVRLQ